jgi:hypothetical protein
MNSCFDNHICWNDPAKAVRTQDAKVIVKFTHETGYNMKSSTHPEKQE